MDELLAGFNSLSLAAGSGRRGCVYEKRVAAPTRRFASSAAPGIVAADESNSSPFLFPDMNATYQTIPPRNAPRKYVELTRKQILAEYAAFLKSDPQPEKFAARLTRARSSAGGFGSSRYGAADYGSSSFEEILSVAKVKELRRSRGTAYLQEVEGDDGDVELQELHEHLLVIDGRLYLGQFRANELTLAAGQAYSEVNAAAAFSDELVESQPLYGDGAAVGSTRRIVYDLGYIGDCLNEYRACQHWLAIPEESWPAILCATADPLRRRPVQYQSPPGTAFGTSVSINARQKRVLDGLRFNIEGIQGPPGTGKSTVIYHITTRYLDGSNSVTLATCVGNKAVDAIAEKFAKAGDIPFFVYGNEKRLAATAKRWTVGEQVQRHPDVLAIITEIEQTEELSSAIREIVNRWEGTGYANDTIRRKVQALLVSKEQRELLNMLEQGYSVESLLEELERRESSLRGRKNDVVQEVKTRIIASARAILCTVATASKSLLTDGDLKPATSRITAAVLDEAGTCSEPKLVLLALLPRLERIIAIGDQKQLAPFTNISMERPKNAAERNVCYKFAAGKRCPDGHQCRFDHVKVAGFSRPNAVITPEGYFQRLDRALKPGSIPSLLDQYRMHPNICGFISKEFYSGTLRTPPDTATVRMQADRRGLYWIDYARSRAGHNASETSTRTSKLNNEEAGLVLEAYRAMTSSSGSGGRPSRKSFMIITFYKPQEHAIRDLFKQVGIAEDPDSLVICSVDQSQGSEADVVILSCVRSNHERKIGFVSNPNRMNVACSRARERLVVIGDARTLSSDAKWRRLVAACGPVMGNVDELPSLAQQTGAARVPAPTTASFPESAARASRAAAVVARADHNDRYSYAPTIKPPSVPVFKPVLRPSAAPKGKPATFPAMGWSAASAAVTRPASSSSAGLVARASAAHGNHRGFGASKSTAEATSNLYPSYPGGYIQKHGSPKPPAGLNHRSNGRQGMAPPDHDDDDDYWGSEEWW